MASVAATRSEKDLQSFVRYVLVGGVLVAAVIVGLLAMHTLNLHGTTSAHAPAAISISVTDSAHHSASGMHESGGSASDLGPACTDCGTNGHLGMAMACVLALLLILIVLVPPRLLPRWMHAVSRSVLRIDAAPRVMSRAPSLHVLCISRT